MTEEKKEKKDRKSYKVLNSLDLWAGIPRKFVFLVLILGMAIYLSAGFLVTCILVPLLFFILFNIHEKDPFALVALIERQRHATEFRSGNVEKRNLHIINS